MQIRTEMTAIRNVVQSHQRTLCTIFPVDCSVCFLTLRVCVVPLYFIEAMITDDGGRDSDR